MNAIDLINALELPVNARVNRRIPKKLLLDNGAPTPADVRQINEGIEELHWVAALKPTNIGVVAYRDETREILEIAVLHLVLRSGAKSKRLSELLHRAIPYPIVLIIEQESSLTLSLADKRRSEVEKEKIVLDGEIFEVQLDDKFNQNCLHNFLEALALKCQPHMSLRALYKGWINILLALQASKITGNFTLVTTEECAASRREALQGCRELESKIAKLQTDAKKEKQIHLQAEHNLTLKRLRDDYAKTCARL